ncbi:MAG: hypothetical protein BJ554DRAFT_29, partial [Olpidium bornovanus]
NTQTKNSRRLASPSAPARNGRPGRLACREPGDAGEDPAAFAGRLPPPARTEGCCPVESVDIAGARPVSGLSVPELAGDAPRGLSPPARPARGAVDRLVQRLSAFCLSALRLSLAKSVDPGWFLSSHRAGTATGLDLPLSAQEGAAATGGVPLSMSTSSESASPSTGQVSLLWIANSFQNQKDLAKYTPLHRIPQPVMNLTSAYFGGGKSFSTALIKNVTSVLKAGWRRLSVNLYYEQALPAWQLCPVRLTLPASSSAATTTTTTSGSASAPTDPPAQDRQIGDVLCSTSSDQLQLFLGALNSWVAANLKEKRDRDVVVLVLNLLDLGPPAGNATFFGPSPNTNATLAARNPGLSIGRLLSSTFGNALYTNLNLQQDRSSRGVIAQQYNGVGSEWPTPAALLDQSSTPRMVLAGFGYVKLQTPPADPAAATTLSTPSLMYTGYNVSADTESVVHPPGSLGIPGPLQNVTGDDGNPTLSDTSASGWPNCSMPLGDLVLLPSGSESAFGVIGRGNWWGSSRPPAASTVFRLASWAWAAVDESPTNRWSLETVYQAARCGYSPNFIFASVGLPNVLSGGIWSWDVGHGHNKSTDLPRCSAMDIATGRWRVVDCDAPLRAACQNNADPNMWTLSETQVGYSDSGSSCPTEYRFAVPRTGQQNAHLRRSALLTFFPDLSAIGDVTVNVAKDRLGAAAGTDAASAVVRLDYNCQMTAGCWVVGQNNPCPYEKMVGRRALRGWGDEDVQTGLINFSAAAGVIILSVVALSLYFKCRRMFRVRKASRRKQEVKLKMRATEYITVPVGPPLFWKSLTRALDGT